MSWTLLQGVVNGVVDITNKQRMMAALLKKPGRYTPPKVKRSRKTLPRATGGHRTDIKHGVCRNDQCSKRTILWMPARLCEKCLLTAVHESPELLNVDGEVADSLSEDARQKLQMLAAVEAELAEADA